MGHQWVKNDNQVSIEYMDGVKEFIDVARKTLNSKGLTLCPCAKCVNSRLYNIDAISTHLINVGIDKSYTRWVYHGEDEVSEEDMGHDVFDNEESDGLRAGLEDAIGHPLFNIGPTSDLTGNQQPFGENNRYEKLHEALSNPLYEGCKKISTLMFVVKLMNFKVMNKWTDSSFEMTLKFLHSVLPDGNNCPQSYYDVRMLLCEAGLGYELIDVCQYDCAIFYGENKDTITCPVCKSSRYVPTTKHNLELFNNKVRTLGASIIRQLGDDVDVVQWYIINNCGDELDVYKKEHKEVLLSRSIQEPDSDTIQQQEFPSWFKKRMAFLRSRGDPRATDDLYALSQFPDNRYNSWRSCTVHGVRFRCKERDDKFTTQCSGVCVGDQDEAMIYYGVLLEVLELDFIHDRKVFMFRCNWYNTDPKRKKMVVDHKLTSIDITSRWYVDEPFILANQAQQVFYLNDLARGKNWMVVQKVNHRNIYDILEHDDEASANDVFQEEESSELPPFQPTEELPDTSTIVRNGIEPETLPYEAVQAIRNANVPVDDLEYMDDDFDDAGLIFVDNESIVDSETERDSDDLDCNSDDDDSFA